MNDNAERIIDEHTALYCLRKNMMQAAELIQEQAAALNGHAARLRMSAIQAGILGGNLLSLLTEEQRQTARERAAKQWAEQNRGE